MKKINFIISDDLYNMLKYISSKQYRNISDLLRKLIVEEYKRIAD